MACASTNGRPCDLSSDSTPTHCFGFELLQCPCRSSYVHIVLCSARRSLSRRSPRMCSYDRVLCTCYAHEISIMKLIYSNAYVQKRKRQVPLTCSAYTKRYSGILYLNSLTQLFPYICYRMHLVLYPVHIVSALLLKRNQTWFNFSTLAHKRSAQC